MPAPTLTIPVTLPDFFADAEGSLDPPAAPYGHASPRALVCDLLLTADTALSHHDPAQQDDSNVLLFNRQKQLLPARDAGIVSQSELDALCAANPAPSDVAALLADLSPGEFSASALLRLFLDIYNGPEGIGLFAGAGRYERLETRLRAGAVRAASLRDLWNRLCHDLQAPVAGQEYDRALCSLFALSAPLQQAALRACTRDYRTAVMLARLWHVESKAQSAAYAEKAGRAQAEASVTLSLQAGAQAAQAAAVLDVPAVSANTLRHNVVRGPGWEHLARRLGLGSGFPGDGTLPAGAEAVFVNGGNIAAGAKQPSNPFGLGWAVRRAWPLLDLLGGVTDSFDLGESRLKVAAWLVCRENAGALADTAAAGLGALEVSAFDLLDDVTHTRQATEQGRGQMIYTFETLCAGSQVLCRLVAPVDAPRLTQGAMAAAIETYLSGPARPVAGQSARGFGWMSGRVLSRPNEWEPCLAEYERYLDDNAPALRASLVDGTLGAGARVVT